MYISLCVGNFLGKTCIREKKKTHTHITYQAKNDLIEAHGALNTQYASNKYAEARPHRFVWIALKFFNCGIRKKK